MNIVLNLIVELSKSSFLGHFQEIDPQTSLEQMEEFLSHYFLNDLLRDFYLTEDRSTYVLSILRRTVFVNSGRV